MIDNTLIDNTDTASYNLPGIQDTLVLLQLLSEPSVGVDDLSLLLDVLKSFLHAPSVLLHGKSYHLLTGGGKKTIDKTRSEMFTLDEIQDIPLMTLQNIICHKTG